MSAGRFEHLGDRLGRRFAAVAGLQGFAVAPRQFGHAAVQPLQPRGDLLAAFDILVRDQFERGRIKAQPVPAAALPKSMTLFFATRQAQAKKSVPGWKVENF